VTRGEKGSVIRAGSETHEIPPVHSNDVVDPTGCGDAYRAGLLYGRARGLSFDVSGRLGSLMGSLQVGTAGTQNLEVGLDEIRSAFQREFGMDL
jgi:adenosine kinase